MILHYFVFATGYIVHPTVNTVMQITQYLHTAVLVSDLERSAKFYGEILGLAKVERSLNFPGIWYQIGDYQIHLMIHPQANQGTVLNLQKWGRNRHLAFAVTDIQAAKAKLEANNYPVQMSSSGRTALFTQDPDGNVIELNQVNL